MIAIVNNMAPPITVLLAFCLLKEKIKKFEMLMLAMTVSGILIVVIGGSSSDASASDGLPVISHSTTLILYGILFFNPVLSAFGTISMRKMKKFHEAVVSFYLNWSIGISSVIVVFALGQSWEPVK